MGTDGAGNESDQAAAASLVRDLIQAIDASKRKDSALAKEVDIARSTVSRWRTGVVPRTFHLQLLGATVGLRLEWAPSDPHWLGAECPDRVDPPTNLWMGERTADHWLQNRDETGVDAAMLDACLLGAEVRWARIYIKCWSLDECPGDRHGWAAFERGLVVQAPNGVSGTHRRYLSSPLRTAAFIGRCLGLELVWRNRSDLHRVRPWEVQKPPPPTSSVAALAQEKSRRPRLW